MDRERMFDDTRRMPFVWLGREITDTIWPQLSDKAARVYISLCALQDGYHSARGCWPGLAYLAKQNNCSQDSVRRAISELVNLRLIVVEDRFTASGAQQSNRYVLIDPSQNHEQMLSTPSQQCDPPPCTGATPPLAPVLPNQYIYDQDINNYSSHSALRLNVSSVSSAKPAQPDSVSVSESKTQTQPNLDFDAGGTRPENAPVAAHKAPESRKKTTKPKSTHDPDSSAVQDILRAYSNECAYEINWGREGKIAKQIAGKGFTVEQVIACYRARKAERYWSDKHLPLVKILTDLPAFLQAQNKPPASQQVVDRKNGILANGWQNLRESDQEREYQSQNWVLTDESVEDILADAMAILKGKD